MGYDDPCLQDAMEVLNEQNMNLPLPLSQGRDSGKQKLIPVDDERHSTAGRTSRTNQAIANREVCVPDYVLRRPGTTDEISYPILPNASRGDIWIGCVGLHLNVECQYGEDISAFMGRAGLGLSDADTLYEAIRRIGKETLRYS
eukprot:GHVQ01034532.1.p1 GENE.GHVQ01034532.1~~GHVQ01034532.1.p1  ORF type:complete len:144 (-),score=9.19 GHVQ01034532.1:104-535(-)